MDEATARVISPRWDLNRPMSQSEFYSLPKGLCIKYVSGLQERYNASCKMIATMLKMSPATLSAYMKDVGYNFNKRGNYSSDQDAWEKFCEKDSVQVVEFYSDEEEKSVPAYVEVSNMSVESKRLGFDRFINECCQLAEDYNSVRWILFQKIYKLWCEETGQQVLTLRKDGLRDYIKDRYGKEMIFYGTDTPGGPSTTLFIKFDIEDSILDKYKSSLYSEYRNMIGTHPYISSTNIVENKSEDKGDAEEMLSVVNSNSDSGDVIQIPNQEQHTSRRFVMPTASGVFTYEGFGEDIFYDLLNRFKGDNIKVKIEWEVLSNG